VDDTAANKADDEHLVGLFLTRNVVLLNSAILPAALHSKWQCALWLAFALENT
jgi:hypothetical protein